MRLSSYNMMFAYRQMNIQQAKMSQALQRLSSGYRINSAKDDPAGLAISERMRAQMTAQEQAIRNSYDAIDMLDTADGTLGEVNRVLDRLVELTGQAASGTLTDAQRQAIQTEANELKKALEQMAGGTNFNGKPLLQGEGKYNEPTRIQIGPSTNSYDQMEIMMPNLNTVIALLDGLDLSTQESAIASMDIVNQSVDMVTEMRGELGAKTKRLEYSIRAQEVALENLTESESRIRDADMAKEMMNFVKASVQGQAAQMMFAHAMQDQYRVLELLKGI